MTKSLIVNKSKLTETLIDSSQNQVLERGQIRLQIERFAITSNNITYAIIGDRFRYWEFFPAREGFGIIPAWGFATVQESTTGMVNPGQRFYGYFPMATGLVVQPDKVTAHGFTDLMPNRVQLPPIYNNYIKMAPETSVIDDYLCLFKPLYTTSFLNHHFIKSNEFFGAKQVILTSASSKTAMGIAQLLTSDKENNPVTVLGLSSASNIDFVKSTGYYDSVLPYSALEQINAEKSIIVDLAGNTSTLTTISDRLQEKLGFISLIGLTDYSKTNSSIQLPQAKLFFAPDAAIQYFKEYGRDKANKHIQEALTAFIKDASRWITINTINSIEALESLYKEMLVGRVDPKIGHIVSFQSP